MSQNVIFNWQSENFQKLYENVPTEPVTPFILKYFSPTDKILEAGCGSGRFVRYLDNMGYNIVGLELGHNTVELLNDVHPHLNIIQGDVRELPFPDNYFSGILSLGVIEHVIEGMEKPIDEIKNYPTTERASSYKAMSIPLIHENQEILKFTSGDFIVSDEIVNFLENRTQIYDFDYLGYECKTVEQVNGIYLMINPDPINFAHVPESSLVISHHKISTHDNRIYRKMIDYALERNFNIYNIHLGWDVMPDGIGDSFLLHFGLSRDEFQKVDLTYKGHKISRLGAIISRPFTIDEIVQKLYSMNVFPSVIINPRCSTNKIGYIPGGGFNDQMIIEMADMGVDVLISSDINWVVETVAREVGVTLIEIDHYVSERYGLQSMKKLLSSKFPGTPVNILENIDNIQCAPGECNCSN